MNDLKHSIKFNYLYRDAGNFKEFGNVIFKTNIYISLSDIEKFINSYLIDSEYFSPEKWRTPVLSNFVYDRDLDHQWCEFVSVELSHEPTSDERTIIQFLNEIAQSNN